jgi:hypothetical protein
MLQMSERAFRERDQLRATLIEFVSCYQRNEDASEELENRAVELCGGMTAIHTYEKTRR